MQMEKIRDRIKLECANDVLLLRPDIVVKALQKRSGINKNEVTEALCMFFKDSLESGGFAKTIPHGLREDTSAALKVLVIARLAHSTETLTPSIRTIARFARLSRNWVSPCVGFLEASGLVETKTNRREQLVLPTMLTDLYIDVISGNMTEESKNMTRIVDELKHGEIGSESIDFLERLEDSFHLGKSAYDVNTINYEIMKDLHDKSMNLLVEARSGKVNLKDFEEFLDIMVHMNKVREKARKIGVQPVILEKTEDKLGRARVFRVK